MTIVACYVVKLHLLQTKLNIDKCLLLARNHPDTI